MDREAAREYVNEQEPDFLTPAKAKINKHTTYICPNCGNGSGSNGTGIVLVPEEKRKNRKEKKYQCFVCGLNEDIVGLWMLHNGMSDHKEGFNTIYDYYGVNIDDNWQQSASQNTAKSGQNTPTKKKAQSEQAEAKPKTDYAAFFLKAHKDIDKTDYWQQRGLSREIINRFKIGYVENWKHPNAEGNAYISATPRLIIPTGRYSYLARDTRAIIPEAGKGLSKMKVGEQGFFNVKALQTATKPIFIVEGEIDAMSIAEVGGEAIALGTAGRGRAFIELVKAQRPTQALAVALDNDEPGQKASNALIAGLQEIGVACFVCNPCGNYKDANEALQKDREGLKMGVQKAEQMAEKVQDETAQAKKENYLLNSAASHLQSFINGIHESVNTPYIPTGFNNLDSVLDGGLYEGLYIVGAISSLGKTTFITQIADQIAQGGKDVLIFSLEMARAEIMAKSISRLTLESVLETGGDVNNAKTARGITTGKRYSKYSQKELQLIEQAVKRYGDYAGHIYISEGVGDIGINKIKETIEEHKKYTGNTPVIVIDYLQILAPYNDRATDKQNTDKAVMELKRISRDCKTPVIGISSFNRTNYNEAVTMAAFKESGAIEYSSDVLIGLQLKGAGTKDFDANAAKRKTPRDVELVILKNRNGRTGDKLEFNYYPLFNFFKESEASFESMGKVVKQS